MRPPEMRAGSTIPSETLLPTEDNPSVSKADQVHRSRSLTRKWTNHPLPSRECRSPWAVISPTRGSKGAPVCPQTQTPIPRKQLRRRPLHPRFKLS